MSKDTPTLPELVARLKTLNLRSDQRIVLGVVLAAWSRLDRTEIDFVRRFVELMVVVDE